MKLRERFGHIRRSVCTHNAVGSLVTHDAEKTCDITKWEYYVCKQLLMQQSMDGYIILMHLNWSLFIICR